MPSASSPDSPLAGGIPPARRRLIGRIVAAAGALRGRRPGPLLRDFVRAYFHGVAEEDLAARPARALAAVALRHFDLGRLRARGRARVELVTPPGSRATLALVVSDDMPFLVDSLGMVFAAANRPVQLLVHPVLAVERDRGGRLRAAGPAAGRPPAAGEPPRESWQLFEIGRETDPAVLGELAARLRAALADVGAAVHDWPAMRARLEAGRDELRARPPAGAAAAQTTEACELLDWMASGQFVFLGYRRYALRRGVASDRVVPLAASGLGILRASRARPPPRAVTLRGEARHAARAHEPLLITKANSLSTVHRASSLDHVGIRIFDAGGEVVGEHRFLGLWTATAYHGRPRDIPLLRGKIDRVVAHFGLAPDGHDAKAVVNVLETYPRDELFQANVPDLIRIVRGIVNLYERRTVRLFTRRDPYGRFWSCMVYVPRDRYTTAVRERIEAIVRAGLHGTALESQVQIAESRHARLHLIVRTDPKRRQRPHLAALEAEIALACSTWLDRLRTALAARREEPEVRRLLARYRESFTPSYRAEVGALEAVRDLEELENLRVDPAGLRVALGQRSAEGAARAHLRIVKRGAAIPISDLVPIAENFGLRVLAERPYALAWPEGGTAWIQDFELEQRDGAALDLEAVGARFREGFLAVWRGEVENDGCNRLLLGAGLTIRQIVVLRACCRYLLQTGVPFSQGSMERALAAHPPVARALLRLFETQFDPAAPARGRERRVRAAALQLDRALEAVASAAEDRILRACRAVVAASLRTNYYAGSRGVGSGAAPALAIKFDSGRLPDLPLPRPLFEVFVYAPDFEAIHLRKARVARGGIRWSDRRDDFRTEILGLMKAQQVKNTLIVPAGAKGGFVLKPPPGSAPREAPSADGVAAYRAFMGALLDLTDNLVDGRVRGPERVVRRDGDDPYLVVAADKGTASFSDIANAIAAGRGFWLDDAFASGGSAGYDHKAMGITARGAWECVRRHFRELGVDVDGTDFTVVGIGDMSGDVFGNGMLRSPHIRLLAAFDHRHIFLDPAPDAARSHAERARLFRLPSSSWDDYDRRLISRGGGVYPRSAKRVSLAPPAQALLGLGPSATPVEIIRAILRLPVDLLWNGGIGTYVKASTESQADAGDRGNDALRVDGRELRARVVGEGGNLGLTQRGRIEYAQRGGRLNTDFIDNSAGVNTSDVEVNLKILFGAAMHAGRLQRRERDRLLEARTGEVAALVVHNNVLQSGALSVMQSEAAARLGDHQALVRLLERSGELDRAVEFLPTDEQFAERSKAGLGLTRPELAVLLAYGKIWLSRHLLESDLPEDPQLAVELIEYFPVALRQRFAADIARHRLRREIIVTAVTNELVNRMGPLFVPLTAAATGRPPQAIAGAWIAAREIFALRPLWRAIETLDLRTPAAAQYRMFREAARFLERATGWLLDAVHPPRPVAATVRQFQPGIARLVRALPQVLAGASRAAFEAAQAQALRDGAPALLAQRLGALGPLEAALDIVQLAAAQRRPVAAAAQVYYELGATLGIDWLRERIEQLPAAGPWQEVARTALRTGAAAVQRRLTERALAQRPRGRTTRPTRLGPWLDSLGADLSRWQRTLGELRAAGEPDFAMLSVGVEAVRHLASIPAR